MPADSSAPEIPGTRVGSPIVEFLRETVDNLVEPGGGKRRQ